MEMCQKETAINLYEGDISYKIEYIRFHSLAVSHVDKCCFMSTAANDKRVC